MQIDYYEITSSTLRKRKKVAPNMWPRVGGLKNYYEEEAIEVIGRFYSLCNW